MIKKTNIIKFPASPSKLERQIEAILFAASERGVLGLFSIIFLFFSWLYPLIKKRKNIIVFSGLGSLIALCFIDSLYLEITKFRFLWFFVGFIIVYSNNFIDIIRPIRQFLGFICFSFQALKMFCAALSN